eukprot:GHVP01019513.1.p2 GENE.GHVP01019513.1~~GHVP01019513.1.p2  ORF type:complete len:194 (-),score=51.02 GHVP01019513.1:676-1257(-)
MQQVGISPKPDAKAAAVITGKPAAVPKEPSKKKNGFLCCGGDPVREPEKKISELETKNSEEALQNKSSSMEKLEIAKLNRGISYVSTVPMMLTSEEVEEEEAAVFGHSKEFGSVLENQGSSKIRKSKEFGLKGSEISQRYLLDILILQKLRQDIHFQVLRNHFGKQLLECQRNIKISLMMKPPILPALMFPTS